MPPTLPFWFAFVVTLLLLVGALVSGLLHRRRLHLVLGPATMVSLAVTIWLTEELLRNYEFPEEVKRLHLRFAIAGGLLAIPVIGTGIWLACSERARGWHRLSVFVWVLSALAATASGLWMFQLGSSKGG